MPLQQGVMNAQRKQLQAIAKGFTIHYASVHMSRRHTVVSLCICVCIYMSVTWNSQRSLKSKNWRMQYRHSATIIFNYY